MIRQHPPPTGQHSRHRQRSRHASQRGRHRQRGQSTVIGAVLLFGILVALVVLIQLSAVPGWNQALEIQHNERVQNDMERLSADVREAAATNRGQTGVIELGVGYPPRPFLYNPPDPTGTVRTTEPASFSVRNVDIVGVDNYWATGSPNAGVIDGTTRQVVYDPSYREYQDPPTTTYENGVLYNEFQRPLFLDRTGFLDGQRITLTAVSGDVSRTGVGTTSVPVEPESAPSTPVAIRSRTADPVELRLPTRLSEDAWEQVLADEYDRNGGYIVDDENGVTVTGGTLVVTLAAGVEYDLRMAQVRVGDQTEPTEPHYVTHVSGAETALRPTEGDRLTFEVRDRFNNPIQGTTVTFEASDGFLSTASARTGIDGEAAVRYTAPSEEGTETVTARIDANGDGDRTDVGEQAPLVVSVSNGTASSDAFSDANPGPGAGQVWVVNATSVGDGIQITFDNDAPTARTLTQLRLSYYYSDDTNPAPSSGTYIYGGWSQSIDIPGPFVAVEGPTLAADGQSGQVGAITVTDLKNNVKDDFIVVHTVWHDPAGNAHVVSYIVSAR